MRANVDSNTWKALLDREEGQCQCCGNEEGVMPCHFIPSSRNGSDTLENLMLLCFQCHRAQHDGKLTVKQIDGKYYFKKGT